MRFFMEQTHFEQSILWRKGAEYIVLSEEYTSSTKYSVAIAMLIHSIIKANDSLTSKYLNTVAKKHDDARILYQELIKKGFVQPQYASYSNIVQDAISNKAKAEYRAGYFSKNDYEEFKRKTDKFIAMVKENLQV